MLEALFQYSFIKNAVFCSILISIVCGIVGTVIIQKRLVMLSGGIAHTSFGGIGFISTKFHQSSDVATAIFWSTGMAMGILFISFTPGYPPDMTSYLFGDILTVSKADLLLTLILDALLLFLIISFYNYLRAYLFDGEFATVLKIKTKLIDILMHIILILFLVLFSFEYIRYNKC